MKSIKSTAILILGSLFVAISFAACSAEDNIPEKAPQVPSSSYPISDVHVIEKGYLKAELNKDNLLDDISQLKAEDFKYTVLSETEAKSLAERKLSDSGSSDFYLYAWTTLNYRCKTADGTEKDLSELIVWPYSSLISWSPSQLVIGCHSTITSNEQRPSNFTNLPSAGEINMLALFASVVSQNALVIVPDYEGYGSTADIPHPYCNRDLTALQVVTGVKAGLSYFENNVTTMKDEWSSVAIGYSQGGAVAAGVLRYCQQNNENSLRLKGAVCGDGP